MNLKKMLSIILLVAGVIMLLIALFVIRVLSRYVPGETNQTHLALFGETVRTGLIVASVVAMMLGAALVALGFKKEAPKQLEWAREEEKEGARSGKKSILRRIGSALVVIAVGTFLINMFIPTSSSYVFFLLFFPIELIAGIILWVVGVIMDRQK